MHILLNLHLHLRAMALPITYSWMPTFAARSGVCMLTGGNFLFSGMIRASRCHGTFQHPDLPEPNGKNTERFCPNCFLPVYAAPARLQLCWEYPLPSTVINFCLSTRRRVLLPLVATVWTCRA